MTDLKRLAGKGMLAVFMPTIVFAQFTAVQDSIAFKKFLDGAEKNAQGITSFYCVMKTIVDMSALQQKGGPKLPIDTTKIRMWTQQPDKYRNEIKGKIINMTMVSNGRRAYIKDGKTGKIQQLDSLPENGQANGPTTTKDILKYFSGKTSFKVLPGDTIAELRGNFDKGNLKGYAVLNCDLQKHTIKEYTVSTSAAQATAKLKYIKIGTFLTVKQIEMQSEISGKTMKMTTVFDSIKVNTPIDTNLFQLN